MAPTEKVAEDDLNLAYFHGALMDQDSDQLLVNEGDYLVVTKFMSELNKMQYYLAVRTKKGIRRYEIKRTSTSAKLGGKSGANIGKLIEIIAKESLEIKGEKVQLKRAIPKGKFQLMHRDVIFKKKIGSGAYGTVYRGRLVKSNKVVAVKKLDAEGADEDGLVEMMKEARVMQLYDHPNIVKFYGFILDEQPYLLVLEYCNGGSVEDRLRDKPHKTSVPARVTMTTQASCGLEYLHKKNCIHRDIATRNCLIHRGIVKMADFGMCRATSVYKVDLTKPLNVRWLAPEVWDNGETKFNTDIYAFGVMIWEMFEDPYRSPYSEWKAYTVKQKVRSGYRMQPHPSMPEGMVAIMEDAWHHNPNKRPTATELRARLEDLTAKLDAEGTVDGNTTNTNTNTKEKN
ncbi:unnamed protein product [Caenorhabditis bovis]|uniref:Protein kinase domain-containing protein n=1 Tax=Caenorhabditis bovis TaxID=2654633 RepID=A0A8S1F5Y2_9PELO|nr:unnamed protein product [Caenorhabditis bovis]